MRGKESIERHLMPSKLDRQYPDTKQKLGTQIYNAELFNKSDLAIDRIYEDIASGMSKSAILVRLQRGYVYGLDKVCREKAEYYYNLALRRFANDVDMKHSDMRNVFYKRYENLYMLALEKGEIGNARAILSDMARIFGIEKKQGPSTAVMINGSPDGKMVINFGFEEDLGDGRPVQDQAD